MSTKVKLSGREIARFPNRCICCLEPPVEHRQATWHLGDAAGTWSGTVALSGIPYCRAHADEHDVWLAWSAKRRDRDSSRKEASAKGSGFFALPLWQRELYLIGPAGALGVFGSVIDPAPGIDLGALAGLATGCVLALVLFAVLRARRMREAVRGVAKPPRPTRSAAGPKLTFMLPALGLNVTAKVDASPSRIGYEGYTSGYAYARALVFHFNNAEYAGLFKAENSATA